MNQYQIQRRNKYTQFGSVYFHPVVAYTDGYKNYKTKIHSTIDEAQQEMDFIIKWDINSSYHEYRIVDISACPGDGR